MSLRVKRIYDPPEASDGVRVLVDRLWPRGISKEKAQLTRWYKEIAPSSELRKRYHSHEISYEEFSYLYIEELHHNPETEVFYIWLEALLEREDVTLLYASKDVVGNHALILQGLYGSWKLNRKK